jgi:hypothetical protein
MLNPRPKERVAVAKRRHVEFTQRKKTQTPAASTKPKNRTIKQVVLFILDPTNLDPYPSLEWSRNCDQFNSSHLLLPPGATSIHLIEFSAA